MSAPPGAAFLDLAESEDEAFPPRISPYADPRGGGKDDLPKSPESGKVEEGEGEGAREQREEACQAQREDRVSTAVHIL